MFSWAEDTRAAQNPVGEMQFSSRTDNKENNVQS